MPFIEEKVKKSCSTHGCEGNFAKTNNVKIGSGAKKEKKPVSSFQDFPHLWKPSIQILGWTEGAYLFAKWGDNASTNASRVFSLWLIG